MVFSATRWRGEVVRIVSLNDIFTVSTTEVQSYVNFAFWIIIALIAVLVVGFVLWKVLQRLSYPYYVTVHKKVGDMVIKFDDLAKKVTDSSGNYYYHYLGLNKQSPVIKDSFLKIVKKNFMVFIPMSKPGFDVWLQDGKIIPMHTNKALNWEYSDNPGWHLVPESVAMTGIDYDAFNFMQRQLEHNRAKRVKEDRLWRMMPYIGLFVIVVAWIVGNILYGQHIENVAKTILGYANQAAQKGLENNNIIQTITGQ